MLRSSPVKAIRLAMVAMVAIVAAVDFAAAVSGEPDRVYMPSWMGINGFAK